MRAVVEDTRGLCGVCRVRVESEQKRAQGPLPKEYDMRSVGLDDVRELIANGACQHGWAAVLKIVETLLYDEADGLQSEGHPRTADLISDAASFVGDAALKAKQVWSEKEDTGSDELVTDDWLSEHGFRSDGKTLPWFSRADGTNVVLAWNRDWFELRIGLPGSFHTVTDCATVGHVRRLYAALGASLDPRPNS